MSLQTIIDKYNNNRIDLAINSLRLYALCHEITEEAQDICKKVSKKLVEMGCSGMAKDICEMYKISPNYIDELEHIEEELDPIVNTKKSELIDKLRQDNHVQEKMEALKERLKPGNNL